MSCVCLPALLAASLLLPGCGGGVGGDAQDPDPVVEDYPIAYVKRPIPVDAQGDMTAINLRQALSFHAGGDLYLRDRASPSAPERNITLSQTGGLGDVKDIEASFDGSKLLFAMRAPDIEGADPEDQPTWNIWEYDIATDRLRRIIASDIIAEDGQDVAPHYLPDGRIVFSSTRQRESKAILLNEGKTQFAALTEAEARDEHALVLHVMDDDGAVESIRQLSFNQSHDLDPSVLESGEVIFSRWDHMGTRDAMSVYKMRPDGTELQIVYGAHSHDTGTAGATVQFLQPREMPDGRILALLAPFTGTQAGGDIVTLDIENFSDNTQPLWINQGMTGSGQAPATVNAVRTDVAPSPGGRFRSAYPLWDGTDRALVSWSPCRLIDNNAIVPCTPERLSAPNLQEAPPLYGVYVYDMGKQTQLPIVAPAEGVIVSEVVAAQPRTRPQVLYDKAAGTDLDAGQISEEVGVLHIRSVYDFDGSYNALGGNAADLAALSDPVQTTADERPARFLRVIKAVSIPDDTVRNFDESAASGPGNQLMREIVGYAPIEPDGSVKVKVPANVPLAISVLDHNGRRIGNRHQNWLQVRPGETVECNGCHSHASGAAHGHPGGPPALNPGALTDGGTFPNTDATWFTNAGETMAEVRTRLDPAALTPSVDLIYDDVWSDPNISPLNDSLSYRYDDLDTAEPVTVACKTAWSSGCRTVIHYEQHIHPLWSRDRGANTCTNCHSDRDANSSAVVPVAQLDLSDGASGEQPNYFKSYVELLVDDNEQEVVNGALQDRLVQDTDANGNLLFEVDVNGDLVLDANDQPIPVMVTVTVAAPMSAAGANSSGAFLDLFDVGGSHAGRLEDAELRLVSEWLDIGAQYYNDPFAAPVN